MRETTSWLTHDSLDLISGFEHSGVELMLQLDPLTELPCLTLISGAQIAD